MPLSKYEVTSDRITASMFLVALTEEDAVKTLTDALTKQGVEFGTLTAKYVEPATSIVPMPEPTVEPAPTPNPTIETTGTTQ